MENTKRSKTEQVDVYANANAMKAVFTAAFAKGLVLKEYFHVHINQVTKGVYIYVANITNQGLP